MIDRYLTANGHTIHVVDLDALTLVYGFPPSVAADKFFALGDGLYVSTHLTFGAMAEFVLGDATFDYALPASFWGSRSDWRDHVRLYAENSVFGQPFNVKRAFVAKIKELLNQ